MQNNQNGQERTKDPMILFRSTTVSKNSKGGDRLTLYMNTEQVQSLITELTATLSNERGAKLDFHTSDKNYENRTFKSTIAFVKAVQEIPGVQAGGQAPRYAPKAPKAPAYDEAKVAKTKRELA